MYPRYRKSKYGAKKAIVDGVTFDSIKEAKRYQELRRMQNEGIIHDLKTQVKFTLIPTQREPDTTGKRGGTIKGKVIEREVAYIADFIYTDTYGNVVIEDTKGFKTPEYIIKRKMMLYFYGIRIREV